MPETVPGTLAEALAALQGRLPRVAKDQKATVTSQRTGKTHTYAYADLLDVTEALMPLLSVLGLSFSCCPTVLEDSGRFVLDYALKHVSGESTGGMYPLPGQGSPQEIGTAITYARRYALTAVTGLAPGGDDDDGKSATEAHEDRQRQPRNVPGAQLAASGQMTRAQKAAHERLAADTVADDAGKRAQRSHPRGPDPDDPWAQDAPAVTPERAAALRGTMLTDPEDKPGSRLESQHRVIERLLVQIGVPADNRADQHNYVSSLLNLSAADSLTSFNDLSYTQAAEAIKLLQAEQMREKADA